MAALQSTDIAARNAFSSSSRDAAGMQEERNDEDTETLMRIGREHFAAAEYADAACAFEKCIAVLKRRHDGGLEWARARCASNLSACALALGDDVGGEMWARESIAAAPHWSKAHARLAACYSSRKGGDAGARAAAAYRAALMCAEREQQQEEKKKSSAAASSVMSYQSEVVRHQCCRLVEGTGTNVVASDAAVAELVACARLTNHASVRVASVLQIARLAASPATRDFFLLEDTCTPPPSSTMLLPVLIEYARIAPEEMDRFCVQRASLASPQNRVLAELHATVIGKAYATTHPLAPAVAGLRNLLLTHGASFTRHTKVMMRGRGMRATTHQKGETASTNDDDASDIAVRFLRHARAMDTLRVLSFRDDTASDAFIFDCLGSCYKRLVERVLAADLAAEAVASGAGSSLSKTISSSMRALLSHGVPDAIAHLRQCADIMELPNHAIFLERLRSQIIKHPLHPDNLLPDSDHHHA